MNGWTPERRDRQAQAIKTWKPWERSTGPKSLEGKAKVARNPWRGGHRQKLRELAKEINLEIRLARVRSDKAGQPKNICAYVCTTGDCQN